MARSVKLYSLSTCVHCRATKKLLDEHNVEYEWTDVDLLDTVDKAAAVAEVKRLNPRCSFPTLLIDDLVIVGYREEVIKEALQA